MNYLFFFFFKTAKVRHMGGIITGFVVVRPVLSRFCCAKFAYTRNAAVESLEL